MALPDSTRIFLLVLGIAILLVLGIAVSNRFVQSTSNTKELRIPALGEYAELGQLYDAKIGQFRPFKVLRTRKLPSDAITIFNSPKVSLHATTSNSFKNRFKLLNINGNTAANILCGLVEPEGGTAFLRNTHSSQTDVSGVLLFKHQTVQENLQIFDEELKTLYNQDVLRHNEATHVLTGITWGANVALTLKGTATSNEHREHLNSALENEIAIISSTGIAPNESTSNFTMSFTSDIMLPNINPTNHEQVREMLNQIPAIIQVTEGGKGAAIEFTFTPLSLIRQHVQIAEAPSVVHAVDEWVLQKFIDIYDGISSVDQQLNDLNSVISSNTICITPETEARMSQLLIDFQDCKLKFRDEFNSKLVDVRSGHGSPATLSNLARASKENKFYSKNLGREMAFEVALQKVNQYKDFQDYNIQYFGSNKDFDWRVQQNLENVIYVLFQSPQFTQNNPEAFKSNLNTFLTTLRKPFNKRFVVDCDFSHTECSTINETTIKQIVNGQLTVHDVNFELKKDTIGETLKIKAIGRFAQIGELFDVRADKFIGRSILNSIKPEDTNLKTLPVSSAETIIVPSGSYGNKFEALNIDLEQQFGILAEIAPLTHSGLYLDPQENKKETGSVVSTRRFSEVELKMNDPEFLHSLDINAAFKPTATHFVSKIEYGFNTIFSIQDEDILTTNATKLQNYLSNLKSAISQFDGKSNINDPNTTNHREWTHKLPELPSNWKIKIFSDIQGLEEKQTIINASEDLIIYLNTTLGRQQSIQNSDQGQPIAYVLEPMQNLRTKGVLGESVSFGLVSSAGETPIAFQSIIDNVERAKNQVNQLSRELKENQDCVTDHHAKMLQQIETNVEATLGSFIPRFKNVVKEIKSGDANQDKLTRLRQDFRNKTYFSGDGRYIEMQTLTLFEQKLHLYKQVKGLKIKYLGRENSSPYFNFILDTNDDKFRYYLLYYKPEWVREKADVWRRASHVFFNSLANGKQSSSNSRLYLVDCDFGHPKCEEMTQPAIHAYKEGKLTSADFLLTVEEDEKEWIQSNIGINSKLQQLGRNIDTLETKQSVTEMNLQKLQAETSALNTSVASNQGFIDGFRTQMSNLTSSVERKGKQLDGFGIQLTNVSLSVEGKWKKLFADYELEPTSVYAPHVEKESKLNNLRWIRDLITTQSNTDLKDEAAKLSNWLLRLQEAENMFESNGSLKSLEAQEKALSELMDEEKLFLFARVLFNKAKYTEALGLFEKIFSRRLVSLGSDRSDTINAQHDVARCRFGLGEYSKALRLFRFAYHKWNQTLGPDNSNTLIAQHNVALMLHKEGKYADALRFYEQVLKKQVSTLGENHAHTKLTKSNIANTRKQLGIA